MNTALKQAHLQIAQCQCTNQSLQKSLLCLRISTQKGRKKGEGITMAKKT
jgi:hypothetical protein